METKLFAGLNDSRMLLANRHEGLGLAIRADKTTLRVGEPLRLHLVYENFSARDGVSATTCQGFTLAAEEETTGSAATTDLGFACPSGDPQRDHNTALPHGEIRAINLSTADTKLRFDHPGRYFVVARWESVDPAERMSGSGSEPAAITSNMIVVEVR